MTQSRSEILRSEGLSAGLAVVTGAGSGIGRAIVLELAGCGVPSCLVGRSISKLQDVAGLTQEIGVESIPLAVDLRDPESAAAVRSKIKSLSRQVELLVHCAATMRFSRVEDSTAEEFHDLLAANLLAPFALTKELLPDICAARGQIVFVNSSIVNHPAVGTVQYAASKHALKGLADGLRQELNPRGVRVISVYPGRTATPLQESVCKIQGRTYLPNDLLQPADVASVVVHALALPNTAEVTDLMIRPAIRPQ
jgi:NADP-dependent 3-hydroxy acid dehydrogenase YdfG